MTDMKHAPYGLWSSPISPKSLSQSLRLNDVAWDSDGQTLVWLEGRSDRGVLVCSRLDGHAPRDLTDELSVRARVGYGGGDFGVGHGDLYFVSGGRIYRQNLQSGNAKAITPAFGQAAAPELSPDGRWLLYVYSYEHADGLAAVDAEGKLWPRKMAGGCDFYMQPRISPDGKYASWIAWNHPNMPWDGTELYLADIHPGDGGLPVFKNERVIAGSKSVAIFQPEFSPDGKFLAYLSDEGDWHNLYLYDLRDRHARKLSQEDRAQLGTPAWAQGARTFGFSHDSKTIYCVRNERGISSLWSYDVASAKSAPVSGLEHYSDMLLPAINPKRPLLAMIVSSGVQQSRVIVKALAGSGSITIVKRSASEVVPDQQLVMPAPITWSTDAETVHGLLYAPRKPAGMTGAPPAIIRIHGGPTGQSRAVYNPEAQFYVTRGYVFLDVNYRGSTGYGRKYMEALRGKWGVYDVEDAVSAGRHLASQGIADSSKLVILGGSAGGYTVLQALVTHPRFFKAGVCLYGVSNMFTLAADTHKFEERYLDSLLGPLPETANLYRDRSPIFHAEKIVDPLAIFQGEIDEVVPREQSDSIVASLKRRGVPHEYHVYEGEGHGWRKSETIEKYYKSVERFLREFVLFA